MLKNPNKSEKALTLVEMQVSLSIMLIIALAALSLHIVSWRSFAMGNGYMNVYSDSRMAMDRMARDIRWAAQVESNYGSYTTSNNSLVLKIPSIDASGNVVGGYYDYVIYNITGTSLHRIVRIDTGVINSGRSNDDDIVAKNCNASNFRLSTIGSGGNIQDLGSVSNLSTVNNIAVSLPINEPMLSLGGSGTTQQVKLTPTTMVKLRNK